MKKCYLIFLIALIYNGIESFAQQTSFGYNITTNYISDELRPELGFVFDKQLNNLHGFETGIYYKTLNNDLYFNINNNSLNITISEHYISLPFLYKYYSNFINIATGLTYDFFIGWQQKNSLNVSKVTSYSTSDDFIIGLTGKISKSFHLDEHLIFEPEIKLNTDIIQFDRYFLGFGLVFKYKCAEKKE